MKFIKVLVGIALGFFALLVFIAIVEDADGEYEEYTVGNHRANSFYGHSDSGRRYHHDDDYYDDDDDYYYDDDDDYYYDDDEYYDDDDEDYYDDDDDYYYDDDDDDDEIRNTPVGDGGRRGQTLVYTSDDDDDDDVAPAPSRNSWGDGSFRFISSREFKSLVADISGDKSKYLGKGPAVVEIYAASSARSQSLAASLEKIAPDYKGSVQFYKVDLDQFSDLYSVYSLKGVPAILFCKGSEVIVYNGAPKSNEDLISKIEHLK